MNDKLFKASFVKFLSGLLVEEGTLGSSAWALEFGAKVSIFQTKDLVLDDLFVGLSPFLCLAENFLGLWR